MCIMKAWELARPTLPSISSRAPDKTHLPARQQDHGNFFMLRWTPRVFRWRFSASVEFTYLRKTPCKSRHELASPAMLCECAMEPSGGYDSHSASSGSVLQPHCSMHIFKLQPRP